MAVDNRERRIQLATGLGVGLLEAGSTGRATDSGRHLLLIHGFTGAKEDFADHLDALAAEGWHVVAPDLRGHGTTDHPEGIDAYGLREFAADVIGIADTLEWERFTLLGHSMGGMVAQHVAIDAGERLDGLILMDTSHGPLGGVDPELVALGRTVVAEGGMAAYLEASKDLPGALDTPAYLRLVATKPGYQEFCDAKTLASAPDMWLAMIDEMLATQSDRLAELAALRMPVLVIAGEQDEPFLPHAERMAGAIPAARLVVVPDAGHSPQFEAPAAWYQAISAFLAEVVERSPATSPAP